MLAMRITQIYSMSSLRSRLKITTRDGKSLHPQEDELNNEHSCHIVRELRFHLTIFPAHNTTHLSHAKKARYASEASTMSFVCACDRASTGN